MVFSGLVDVRRVEAYDCDGEDDLEEAEGEIGDDEGHRRAGGGGGRGG